MKGMYDFIVEPLGERYDNTIKVSDVDLVVNTNVESFKSVNIDIEDGTYTKVEKEKELEVVE